MTNEMIITNEILSDEQLDGVTGGGAGKTAIKIVKKTAIKTAKKQVKDAIKDKITNPGGDDEIPDNATPDFELIKPDFMPKI